MTEPARTGLHHLELWTADLALAEPSWDWLLTALGWSAERVEGWESGRIWRHGDGSYIVLEQSGDVEGAGVQRRGPGMNHLALTIADRAGLEGRSFPTRWPPASPAMRKPGPVEIQLLMT